MYYYNTDTDRDTHPGQGAVSVMKTVEVFCRVVCCPRKTQQHRASQFPVVIFQACGKMSVTISIFTLSKMEEKKRQTLQIVEQHYRIAATLNICLEQSLQQAWASSPADKFIFSFITESTCLLEKDTCFISQSVSNHHPFFCDYPALNSKHEA